jgi:hypothetical protein
MSDTPEPKDANDVLQRDGIAGVQAMIEAAVPAQVPSGPIGQHAGDRAGQHPNEGGGDGAGGEKPKAQLPDGCPVTALGVSGDTCHYLDAMRQYRDLKAKDHSRLQVQHLFGAQSDLLYEYWPRKVLIEDKKTGESYWDTKGWKPELAAENLMRAAAVAGTWSPHDKLRGGGAWRGDNGELVLHVGDGLLLVPGGDGSRALFDSGHISWNEVTPGLHGDKVYPTQSRLLRPHAIRQLCASETAPAKVLLAKLSTWNWRRPDIDPYLLLGWICAAMIAGALKWRPMVWVTGGKGTGKSTLLDLIWGLYGPGGMLKSPDPSAAAVRQLQRHAATPVGIDEGEPEAGDNSRMYALVKLARDAATGALAIRGGSNHEASSFQLRMCMFFSSILIPALSPQDKSRIAVLDLKKLLPVAEGGAKQPRINERELAELGSKLMRRLVDQWHRADATIEAYRDAMAELGLDARSQDVYGTLLGCADLALADALPEAGAGSSDGFSIAAIQEKLRPWILAEQEGNEDDSRSCLNYLATLAIEAGSDRRRTPIGTLALIADYVQLDGMSEAPSSAQAERAQEALAANGLRVVRRKLGNKLGAYLAVPNKHAQLARLFDRTIWGSKSGADGVWKQSLQRLVEDRKECINFQIHMGGTNCRCTMLPLELIRPLKAQESNSPGGPPAASAPQDPTQESTQDPAPAMTAGTEPGTAFTPPLGFDQTADEIHPGEGDPASEGDARDPDPDGAPDDLDAPF